jgi:pyruvate/2-oxoglutarate dehydrogenase complex dihydrolipoamide acyltransferase (E2) component
MITVGGIATKPRYVNGKLEPRELLDLTISVDHAVVDGATAARFARRLTELLQHPIVLSEHPHHEEAGAALSNPPPSA